MTTAYNRKIKQAQTFDKGQKAYLIKAALIGGVGGLFFGIFMTLASGSGFDFLRNIESKSIRQILTILICTVPFALVGLRIAYRTWEIVKWDAFTLNFNIGDSKQKIEDCFGKPSKVLEKNNTEQFFYTLAIDNRRQIKIKSINFFFKDDKLTKYNRF